MRLTAQPIRSVPQSVDVTQWQEDLFLGLIIGFEAELGYFSLTELESVKGPMGLSIERDEHFKPKTLQELKNCCEQKRLEMWLVGWQARFAG